jgi:hypothetical protein
MPVLVSPVSSSLSYFMAPGGIVPTQSIGIEAEAFTSNVTENGVPNLPSNALIG